MAQPTRHGSTLVAIAISPLLLFPLPYGLVQRRQVDTDLWDMNPLGVVRL